MTILRGPVLWPLGPRAAVALADGVVDPALPAPRPAGPDDPPPEDGLIVPAFADWHFHWEQRAIAGIARPGGPPLLDWLRLHAWPAEEAFVDADRTVNEVAGAISELRAAGTLAGAAFGSPFLDACAMFLAQAGPAFVGGPAVMTTGGTPALRQHAEVVVPLLDAARAGFGRRIAVSPRFALSCDRETLRALGRFAARHDLVVQTHLSESPAEVEAVRRAFPEAGDYLGVYERAGLVGRRTLLAHAVHVSDSELRRIALADAIVVHCPTSNAALGSGRMPLERLRAAGVRWTLGSDVGAGPSFVMLDAIAAAEEQHAGHAPVGLPELLHRATLGLPALLAGRTETDAAVSDRPGALVVAPPHGADIARPDAAVWLRSLVDDWRRARRFDVRRAVPWELTAR